MVTEFYTDDVLQVASWRNVFVQRWIDAGQPEQLRAVYEAEERFIQMRPQGGAVTLSIVEITKLAPLSKERRDLISENIKLLDPYLIAGATVVLSTGFTASMIRGITAGLSLALRAAYPTRTFGGIREAAKFVAPFCEGSGGSVTVGEIILALDSMGRRGTRLKQTGA